MGQSESVSAAAGEHFAYLVKMELPWWRPASEGLAVESEEDGPVCTVCLERRKDVHVPAHLNPVGDIGGHLVCQECLARCDQQCPLCRTLLVASDLLAFAEHFASAYEEGSGTSHADEMADTLHRWQAFELEHPSPRAMSMVATLVLKSPRFRSVLERARSGDETCQAWVRDAAAIVLRLLAVLRAGLVHGGPTEVADLEALLESVVANMLKPFEQKKVRDGEALAALYTQALVLWRLASASGVAKEESREVARRVARALASPFLGLWPFRSRRTPLRPKVHEFLERHRYLVNSAHSSLWPVGAKDPVLEAFKWQ